ncbi:hypothetical protein M752DRAFT_284670 [Aspergillus phoenicis ATCC 13157]|uniref:LITAF domain-containing protein n=1 Tax=Aspergillus phoenicis ATCC 13157 TaxID=1353007 RepID=A0A370PG97_ASPPH|nr:hypothetical protein M752DRAFT_284670 [Aspergillus phoenicis ATCC 13157]
MPMLPNSGKVEQQENLQRAGRNTSVPCGNQEELLQYRGTMTAKFPQSAGQIQYNAESSSVEKPSAQWRENRHASLQIQNENYRPESGQYATRFEGYPGAEHPGQSTGHDQCLHSPRPEEDGLWPPTSYSSTLSAKPIGPSQTPMSTNRGIATPLSCLSRAAAQVDCPNCSHRTMTNISYEVGNTTHMWALLMWKGWYRPPDTYGQLFTLVNIVWDPPRNLAPKWCY